MKEITVNDLAGVLSGEVIGDGTVTVAGPVQTDSRQPLSGGLFVAKPGEQTDGHLFVRQAASAGAAAALVEREVADAGIPQIIVVNVVESISVLAAEMLRRLRAEHQLRSVIAITGSAGKTTTKHILGHILASVGETVIPQGSFNNEVGAPLTMLRANTETVFLVVEMGASAIGDIQALCEVAQPDVGVVLQVGMAHVGEFGGREQIQKAKAEMVEALSERGTAVLNRDDHMVAAMAILSEAPIRWFGEHQDADVRISQVRAEGLTTAFSLTFSGGQTHDITLNLLGEHNAWNAAAAAAAASAAGVSQADIVAGLNTLTGGERWRMQVLERSDGVSIINDAYNASPASVAAGLKSLAVLGRSGRRTVAVLGAMSELGEFSLEEHQKIGLQVVRLNIDQLVVVGSEAKLMYLAASQEGSWGGEAVFCETSDDASLWLDGYLEPGDVVLVKSSNSAGLRFLGDRLAEETA